MITEETYLEMVRLIKLYECDGFDDSFNKPYIQTITLETTSKYNPNYGKDIECKCGHPYYRHFDTYDDNNSCGCKYCPCYHFESLSENRDNIINKILE